jgi:hypothetical protein
MLLWQLRRIPHIAFAAAAMLGLAGVAAAASTVTYTASGTFSPTIVSGSDNFKLAGEPFSISIVASESAVPFKTGAHWAAYNKLMMTGTIQSGLLPTPTPISSASTFIVLSKGNASYDLFELYFPLNIIGTQFNVKAVIKAPKGTLPGTGIAPFNAPVSLTSSNSVVGYEYLSNGTPNSTTLTIGSGTLSTTVNGPAQ